MTPLSNNSIKLTPFFASEKAPFSKKIEVQTVFVEQINKLLASEVDKLNKLIEIQTEAEKCTGKTQNLD